jgi:hypothetical protein
MKRWLLTIVLLLAPRVASACPVCFGQSDAPLARATNLGIIAMLVVVAGVLAGFAAFMVYLYRRARLFEGGIGPADGAPYRSGEQEGIA